MEAAGGKSAQWPPQLHVGGPHSPVTPLRKSSCWGVCEHSLRHESFNAIVEKRRVDATEVLVRSGCMSKQAMMGDIWTPSALVSRRTAAILHDRLSGKHYEAHQPLPVAAPATDTYCALSARGKPPSGIVAAEWQGTPQSTIPTPMTARGGRRVDPATVQAIERQIASAPSTRSQRDDGSEFGDAAPPALGKQPFPAEGLRHPHAYSPHEAKLHRDSYNAIINRTRHQFDPSGSLVKETNLGRQALMGPDWAPSAMMTRRLADGGGSPSAAAR